LCSQKFHKTDTKKNAKHKFLCKIWNYQIKLCHNWYLTKLAKLMIKHLFIIFIHFNALPYCLDQCFSTGGPRPSSGPRSSFGGPPGFFFFFAKNDSFIHEYKKNDKKSTLVATKASRNNKIC
jgi:hypothetical protein